MPLRCTLSLLEFSDYLRIGRAMLIKFRSQQAIDCHYISHVPCQYSWSIRRLQCSTYLEATFLAIY